MSFDLFLSRFSSGSESSVDRSAVLEVLRRHCNDTEGEFGFYTVPFEDGSRVEFSARGLESGGEFNGCAFHLRHFSKNVISFVYEVALAGDMVIFNAQGSDTPEEPLAVAVNEHQVDQLPAGAASNPAICSSPDELAHLLGVTFEQWDDYRNHVLGKSSSKLNRPGFRGGHLV